MFRYSRVDRMNGKVVFRSDREGSVPHRFRGMLERRKRSRNFTHSESSNQLLFLPGTVIFSSSRVVMLSQRCSALY
jgi:hypothetical protein